MASCSPKTKDDGGGTQAVKIEDETRGRKRPAESTDQDNDNLSLPTPAKHREFCHNDVIDLTLLPEQSTEKKAYTVVDEEDQIKPALAILRERDQNIPFLSVDCEGVNLSRKGELSLVSVATVTHVYLFDIKKLGATVFDRGLRELLEDPDREKLMFDCRQDSDCLWHNFEVKLANVLDLQLMQVIYRETHPEPVSVSHKPRSSQNCIKDQPRVRGLLYCLETYVKDEKLIQIKKKGMDKMDSLMYSRYNWMTTRPLDQTLLTYAAADVRGFFKVYHELKQCVYSSTAMARLRRASQKYLDFFRSREQRLYDGFETNSFLPWRLLPEYEHFSYGADTECFGCKRCFPRSDFSNIQLRNGVQKCPVCKKVKEKNDINACRSRYDYDCEPLNE